jgi:hypothetical protein
MLFMLVNVKYYKKKISLSAVFILHYVLILSVSAAVSARKA